MDAIDNLEDIAKRVPGIGVLLIGEGDLTQQLGCPRAGGRPCRGCRQCRAPAWLPG